MTLSNHTGPQRSPTMLALCIGSVLLVLFDWMADYDFVSLVVSRSVRGFLLVVFCLYIAWTGVAPGKYGFRFGGVLSYYAALNIVFLLFSSDLITDLYYVVRVLYWIFGTLVAYRLARSGLLTEKVLKRTIVPTVLLGAFFTTCYMYRPNVEAGQNASAYLLLWCLPLLLLLEESRFVKCLVAFACFAIVLTVKRGAMVGLLFSTIAYTATHFKIHRNLRAFERLAGLFVLLAAFGGFALVQNWDAVQVRFEDTSGSGRDEMYRLLIDRWLHAEPKNLVFGFGVQSVGDYTSVMYNTDRGSYAHSDWLEMMHDFGLLGIAFLIWLHVQFLLLIRTGFRKNHPYTPALTMGYVVLFLVNIYSGHLMAPGALYFGILIAFASAAVYDKPNARHERAAVLCGPSGTYDPNEEPTSSVHKLSGSGPLELQ